MIRAKLVILTYRAGAFNLGGHRVTLRVLEGLAAYPALPVPKGLITFLSRRHSRAQGYALSAPLGLLREGPDCFSIIANRETYTALADLPATVPALDVPALVFELIPELATEVIRASGLYRQIYPHARQKDVARWPEVLNFVKELGLTNKDFAQLLGLYEALFYYYLKRNRQTTTVQRVPKKRPRRIKRRKTRRPQPARLRPANGRDYIGIGQLTLPFAPSKGAGQ